MDSFTRTIAHGDREIESLVAAVSRAQG